MIVPLADQHTAGVDQGIEEGTAGNPPVQQQNRAFRHQRDHRIEDEGVIFRRPGIEPQVHRQMTGQIQDRGQRSAQDRLGHAAQGATLLEDGFQPTAVQDPDAVKMVGHLGQQHRMGGRALGGALLQLRNQVVPYLCEQLGRQRVEPGRQGLLTDLGWLHPQQRLARRDDRTCGDGA